MIVNEISLVIQNIISFFYGLFRIWIYFLIEKLKLIVVEKRPTFH
jgi:hypothetical protein